MRTIWLALVAVFLATTIGLADAEAKRMGGGRSVGKQAPSGTIQRDATPSQPGTPASPGAAQSGPSATPATPAPSAAPSATAPRPAQPAAGPAAASGGSRWLGPIAGLAAGLGLAALASHLGFGEELASIMLIALMAMVALFVVRMILSRRSASQPRPATAGAYGGGYGAAREASPASDWSSSRPAPSAAPVRPVETAAVAVPQAVAVGPVPAGFDVDGFLRNAKVYFVRLQAAFDAGDTNDLREFTSPEMFAELKLEIDQRRGAENQTDVVTLDARLLGVEAGADEHLASVRFTGMLREQPGAAAEPFDEVWNFERPVSGKGGWVLAGIQQTASQA
jgi:predicted lipid-binding transport protein (Tim44 family)